MYRSRLSTSRATTIHSRSLRTDPVRCHGTQSTRGGLFMGLFIPYPPQERLQVRRTTGAPVLLPANPVYLLKNSRCFVVALVRLVTISPWPGVGSRLGTPYLFLPPISRPPLASRPASPPCPVMPSPRAASLPCHCSSSDSPGSSKIEVFHALKAYNFRV